METEKLIKEYSDELYSSMPIFFDYLEIINLFAQYIGQIESLIGAKTENINEYKTSVDFLSLIELCNQILSTLDRGLCDKFNKRLADGTINLDSEEELSITAMTVVDHNIDINVKRTYTIEDVLGLIHEFFHSIHIEKYDNDMQNANWYFSAELIAMIGEFYAIMYLNQNNIFKDDLIEYLKGVLNVIFAKANDTLITGLTLEIYDKEQSISDEAVQHFIRTRGLPQEYGAIIEVLEELEDFEFHDNATYIFGFPISMLIATKMLEDDSYKRKMLYLLEHINEYSPKSLLTYLGVEGILSDEDYICSVINYICEVSNKMIEKEHVNIRGLLLEMR